MSPFDLQLERLAAVPLPCLAEACLLGDEPVGPPTPAELRLVAVPLRDIGGETLYGWRLVATRGNATRLWLTGRGKSGYVAAEVAAFDPERRLAETGDSRRWRLGRRGTGPLSPNEGWSLVAHLWRVAREDAAALGLPYVF